MNNRKPPILPVIATALAHIMDGMEDHSVEYPGLDDLPLRMKAIRLLEKDGFKNPSKEHIALKMKHLREGR